ncbi:unnamed protein product [Phytophthora fragariaefolia]|uniref:Unnamed protein product n=1 Tax=Phytophthora fragariaefolia TaxID=1490495 RepID=A0A9W6XUA3_9STRA|nr:unnamed protein product [Phytophthora fragariaefolia]
MKRNTVEQRREHPGRAEAPACAVRGRAEVHKNTSVEHWLPFADDSVVQQALRDTGMPETEIPFLEDDEVSSSESSASGWSSRRPRKSKRNRSGRRRLRRRCTAVDQAPSSENLNVVEYSEPSPNQIRKIKVANPPSDAATITRHPDLSWKYFLRDLMAGEIDQVCLLTGSDRPAVLANAVSDDASLSQPKPAEPKSFREARFAAQPWSAFQDSNIPVYSLAREFADIFPEKVPTELPAERGVRHEINLVPGAKYCVTRQWPLPRDQVQAIDDFFEGHRKAGHMRKSIAPHSSPTFCVKKATDWWRVVHAFNKLNDACGVAPHRFCGRCVLGSQLRVAPARCSQERSLFQFPSGRLVQVACGRGTGWIHARLFIFRAERCLSLRAATVLPAEPPTMRITVFVTYEKFGGGLRSKTVLDILDIYIGIRPAADTTVDVARSVQFEDDEARGQGYDEEDEDDEEKEEVDVEYVKSTAELLGEVEELSLQVSQMEMRTRSEWMMMFAPVAMAQAKWPVLGPELTQPINSTGINQLVEDTVLLLKAMGYRCNSRPNNLMLSGWSLAHASAGLSQWKRRLRAEFGLEKAPGARQTIMDRDAEFTQLGADPSRVPLPKPPETKRPAKGERFRGGRYDHLYDARDEAELGDSRDDSADLRGGRDETVKTKFANSATTRLSGITVSTWNCVPTSRSTRSLSSRASGIALTLRSSG